MPSQVKPSLTLHDSSWQELSTNPSKLGVGDLKPLPSVSRLGKNELHDLRGVQLFFRFSAKFVNFSAKFESLNMQIRNDLKIVIFIVCKYCKTCKNFVNIMVI